MPAYVLILRRKLPADREAMRPYVEQAVPLAAAYGGGYHRMAAQRLEVLEGDWHPPELNMLKFPSFEQARAWYYSPEYTAVKRLRQAHARNDIVLVEALDEGQSPETAWQTGPQWSAADRARLQALYAEAERRGISPDRLPANPAPEPTPLERIEALLPLLDQDSRARVLARCQALDVRGEA